MYFICETYFRASEDNTIEQTEFHSVGKWWYICEILIFFTSLV